MADAVRETILDALKTCLEGITTANGYAIQVAEVRRGIHFEDDMLNRPCLGFANTKIERKEHAFAQSGRELNVLIYGYVDVEPHSASGYDPLDDLMQAVETRLMTGSAWSYWEFTDIRNFTIYEGGAHDKLGYFDMEVIIEYQYALASP